MKIGISLASAYQVTHVRDGARQMIDRARAAAHAGLDSLFVGDHHATPAPYYQNTPMMGRLLAEWDERPAGALFLLPLWHPVLLAEQIATLACITRGKFIMQCGLGYGEQQFMAMGANMKHRPSAFEQSLSCVRALWRGESVSLDGRWLFNDASIAPLPPEPIEVWIGASVPQALERAARLGDAWLASPGLTLAQARDSIATYLEALDGLDKPTPPTIAIRRDVYVAESADEGNRVLREIESRGYRGFNTEALVIGDAESVAEQFTALGDLGFTDIIIRNLHRDPAHAVASTERMAEVKAKL
ncbi:MAG TPA: LLM class flavin-dependent oxidoreductase [Pseudomonadales bacterium]|nr:LLM class flavin-dependent oxidoreductase [Pseudomonadales bacterium]